MQRNIPRTPRRCGRRLLLILAGAFSVAASPIQATEFARPNGLYLLDNGGQPPDGAVLALPFVDGFARRLSWRQIETAPGQYDWTVLDSTVDAVQQAGKALTLVVFAKEVPDHVLAAVPATEHYFAINGQGADVETVVTWSAAGQAAWQAFSSALAGHLLLDQSSGQMVPLSQHPSLRQIDASLLGLAGLRDLGGRLVAHPDYQRQLFIDQGVLPSLHAIADRFPNKFVYTAVFGWNDGAANGADQIYDAIQAEFDGGAFPRIGLFQENLSCTGPAATNNPLALRQDQTFTMYQMLQSWVMPSRPGFEFQTDECLVTTVPNDRSTAISGPEVGLERGLAEFGAQYFEIYRPDLAHPGFADEFQTWHDLLQALREPSFSDGFE